MTCSFFVPFVGALSLVLGAVQRKGGASACLLQFNAAVMMYQISHGWTGNASSRLP